MTFPYTCISGLCSHSALPRLSCPLLLVPFLTPTVPLLLSVSPWKGTAMGSSSRITMETLCTALRPAEKPVPLLRSLSPGNLPFEKRREPSTGQVMSLLGCYGMVLQYVMPVYVILCIRLSSLKISMYKCVSVFCLHECPS